MAALAGHGHRQRHRAKSPAARSANCPAATAAAGRFVEAIEEAGIVEQDAADRAADHPQAGAGDRWTARRSPPCPGRPIKLEVIYDFEAPPPVGRQIVSFRLGDDDFVSQLAPARTFVFEEEARELRARGLGKHLTPKDLLVISPTGPIDNDFRFADECARHKVLDLIGDLFLVGRPFAGGSSRTRAGIASITCWPASCWSRKRIAIARIWCIATRRWTSAGSSGFCRTAIRCCWSIACWKSSAISKAIGHQERHVQRHLLPGPLPRHADHAGRADRRSDGPAWRAACSARSWSTPASLRCC